VGGQFPQANGSLIGSVCHGDDERRIVERWGGLDAGTEVWHRAGVLLFAQGTQ
jgi:hypothetical protein